MMFDWCLSVNTDLLKESNLQLFQVETSLMSSNTLIKELPSVDYRTPHKIINFLNMDDKVAYEGFINDLASSKVRKVKFI